MNMKLYNKNIGKRLVISVLLFHLFTFLPLSAQTVKNIAVSQEQSYTDHISLEGDVTDKDIMVKFVFDEAANQLTVTLISHRMIFVFREDVRFKPLIKGRRLRPDQLPYVVTYEPKDQYRISKLFKTTVPKPTKKYVFHRWIDYEGLQPAPQEYAMVNDYISQTFDILKKSNSVVVRLRDVMLMNDVSKHINKRRFEIPFGRDLYTEYHVDIQRNPCFGLDEDIASAKAALEGVRKSYNNLRKSFGSGTVDSEESLKTFQDLVGEALQCWTRELKRMGFLRSGQLGITLCLTNDCFVDYVSRRDNDERVTMMVPGRSVADKVAGEKSLDGQPLSALYQHEYRHIDAGFPYPSLTLAQLGIPQHDIVQVTADDESFYFEIRREE